MTTEEPFKLRKSGIANQMFQRKRDKAMMFIEKIQGDKDKMTYFIEEMKKTDLLPTNRPRLN